jgi:integrase/recombinase XerD
MKLPPETLSDLDVQALMAACGKGPSGVRNRALIAVLHRSGVRCGEALALMPRDVLDGSRALRVRHGKQDKDRLVSLGGEASALLAHWLAVRDGLDINGRRPVFCTIAAGTVRQRGEALDPSYVRHLLKRLAVKAGLDRRVHPHGLRHTHAAELVMAGVSLVDIRDQLGHSNAATTDTYLRRIAPRERLERLRSAGF